MDWTPKKINWNRRPARTSGFAVATAVLMAISAATAGQLPPSIRASAPATKTELTEGERLTTCDGLKALIEALKKDP